ncbi:hypothetical protein [Yersinia massiliensis]|uniref:hypothetical protein n=1 Tax=Yersinia massiliensis TaxID=419257 RepID=UPI00209C344F|nr:hypothetical protein [Yersinia massiliensis]
MAGTPGSVTSVQVTGNGTRWDANGAVIVGYTGQGTLTIADGAVATAAGGTIGATSN